MQPDDLQQRLLQLFEPHEVELEPDEDGWLLTDGDYPAIRASWHAGQPGRLDIDLVLAEDRMLEEAFAGADAQQALDVFAKTALPALLAACWYVTDERRLTVTSWELGLRTWDVFYGPPQVQGEAIEVPAAVAEALAEALRQAPLAAQLHWLRWVVQCQNGALEIEALLDNEPHAASQQALARVAWPAGEWRAHGLVLLDVRDY